MCSIYRWPKNAGRIDAGGVVIHNIGLALWITGRSGAMAGQPGLIIYAGTVVTAALHRRLSRVSAAQFRRHLVGPQARPQSGARGTSGLVGAGPWLVVGPWAPEISPTTTSTISTPTSPPIGCANATARLRETL
jgi:hypothetical protein